MSGFFRPFAIVSLVISLSQVASTDLSAYGVTSSGAFGTLDIQTGVFSVIGTPGNHFEDITTLAGQPLLATDNATHLLSINPSNGSVTQIATMGSGVGGVKFRSDGTLFGYSASQIFTVNASTGSLTLVGSIGFTSVGLDLSFDQSGRLFLESSNGTTSSLYSINQSTGLATLIGATGFNVSTLNYENGTLYGIAAGSPEQIVAIDTNTGIGTIVANISGVPSGVINGLAPLVSVPEPSSIMLCGIAGLMALTVARHRGRAVLA